MVEGSNVGSVGGSDEPVLIVLPLVAVEVDGDRLVTSSSQLLVVGPACERIANKRHTACTCAVHTIIKPQAQVSTST